MTKKFRHDVHADTWVGTNSLGRVLPGFEECGPERKDRYVGIFYFICNNYQGEEAVHDVSRIIAANPDDPAFVPGKAHYWGEPELGYYLSTDRWVIRRHAYMLADAGVDTLIFDVTNDVTFPQSYLAVCEVFQQVRAEGERTPDVCFLASERSIEQLWADFYAPGLHKDLWFQWQGKPLLLFGQWEKRGDMNQVVLPQDVQDFFTIRHSWAWDTLPWYEQKGTGQSAGYHRWPWVAHYPQCVGWDEPGVAEMVPVAVGQHPLSNIGRSFHDGQQPPTNHLDLTEFTDQGLHFAEQWRHALEVDPQFIFITGWNEWTAGCAVCDDPSQEALQAKWDFFPGAVLGRAGKLLQPGDHYFIDQYNQEYSRDVEPMRGGHSDNYYYQMVANIRRFKGVRPQPVSKGPITIRLDGDLSQWDDVQPEYRDHQFDTLMRDEPGWGSLEDGSPRRYVNNTGRNEIVRSKVSWDESNVYFLAETRLPLSSYLDPNWMLLFINTDLDAATGWLGYDYLVNYPVIDHQRTTIKMNVGGWDWQTVGEARLHVQDCHLVVALPRRLLGLEYSPLAFDFHWIDHLQNPGDSPWMGGSWREKDFITEGTHGDSAPPRRFDYRFTEPAT